ncbi:1305_t:CDS:2 [Ambispora gerdemannii]|uniref:1305_t:CDS:1 n=1 Tax=Ambispora gerdemannii TaxID=144530 RepID=A0A9N9BJT8_9GLOM|nr:1305_t:CDS:2 [Ambispora gerdemannii]
MVKAQEWLDKKYFTKIRKTTTKLDVKNKNLEGSLDLKEFTNLQKLDCSDNLLTELDIRGCSKLTKLYCHNNHFEKLYLGSIAWRKKVRTTPVLSSFSLDSTTLVNDDYYTSTPLFSFASRRSSEISSEKKIKQELAEEKQIRNHIEGDKLLLQQKIADAQKQLIDNFNKNNKSIPYRNILLIGRTGNGKSALANVLSNSHEFKENPFGDGETREIQAKEFTYQNIKYRVIDIPGVGGTKLSEEQILDRIIEVAYHAREGINQMLFVTRGRFNKDEIDAYKLAKAIFADKEEHNEYITIVRTGFAKFKKEEECEEDIRTMVSNGGELSKLIKEAFERAKIVHIDNPSTDTEEEKK